MDTLRRSLLLSPLALTAGAAVAQTAAPEVATPKPIAWPTPATTIDLWPTPPKGPALTEIVEEVSTDPAIRLRRVQGISTPRLAVFPAKNPNGGAMLIIPGGGFSWNYFDHEGYQLADFLTSQGFTCFVLFYRLANDGWNNRAEIGLIDAQRAMRVIRHHAATFKIDPARVGVTGFSAGGFITASLSTRHAQNLYPAVDGADKLDARPFASAPIYPVLSLDPKVAYDGVFGSLFGGPATLEQVARHSPELNVDDRTPPTFLCHAEDDATVPVANSTLFRDALKASNIPVETHLFARGGHGFGMKPELDQPWHLWSQLLAAFLNREGLAG
ncbi:alpha/beta hydrolase [Asticcacaulis sp. AC402]|uniref:alpha/beta hydrolase n=1 Tax=Asticcacaulis sp. AC402 TaxID=1282361 RepID=UPI0003C3C391|nr:alpha/beta hydrolase [Asticcacaulis sp. AC402]ESQ77699.1 hypothetical protein ABAC402_00795 [Asticcacaulis sp. AC402]